MLLDSNSKPRKLWQLDGTTYAQHGEGKVPKI